MKILFINTIRLEKNGITTFILNNAKYLSQENNNVSILAPNNVNHELEKIIVSVNHYAILKSLQRLSKIIILMLFTLMEIAPQWF